MKRNILIILVLITCSRNMRGQVWTNLIDSVPGSQFQLATAVVDSNSNTLYLGGYFYSFNQFPFMKARAIIRYNGNTFDTLQSGIDYHDSTSLGIIYSMQMFKNKLYVFGQFKNAGKYKTSNVGRWNGTSWDSLDFPLGIVRQTDVYNGELYIGGGYDSIGDIAKFDGISWHKLSYPIPNSCVTALKNYNGRLYVSAMVASASSCANLSYYDGNSWTPWVGVSGDNNKSVSGMNVIDSMLYVYGRFNSIAGTNCRGLAAYNSNTNKWYGFGSGLSNSTWETIYNVQKVNGEIYVTGNFYTIEDVSTVAGYPPNMKTEIVKLVGNKWCALSEPFDNLVSGVIGYQNNLYAYGSFRQIGNDTLFGFVRWDGGNSTAACSSTFSLNVVDVGLGEEVIFDDVKIYPNPANETLNLELLGIQNSKIKLVILNNVGQISFVEESLNEKNKIDMRNLEPGIYFVQIQSLSNNKTFKIIKR